MKKYFLFTMLVSFVLLGLGNVSGLPAFAQAGLTAQEQLNLDNCGDKDSLYNSITNTCSAPNINSIGPTSTLTPCSDNKANAHVNSFGKCVCDDNYKDVGGTCTSCAAEGVCCGIELNTSIPFIGKCIENDSRAIGGNGEEISVTSETAFPVLMGSLTQILVTVILIVSFVLILIGGIMITTGNPSGGKKMIIKVVIGIALLGASGVILRLINPNFFG